MKKKKVHNLPKFKKLLEMDMVPTDTDSMWNRQTSIKKSKNGKDVQQMLGLDDEGHVSPEHANPLSMMDIVLQHWEEDEARGDPTAYESEEEQQKKLNPEPNEQEDQKRDK